MGFWETIKRWLGGGNAPAAAPASRAPSQGSAPASGSAKASATPAVAQPPNAYEATEILGLSPAQLRER